MAIEIGGARWRELQHDLEETKIVARHETNVRTLASLFGLLCAIGLVVACCLMRGDGMVAVIFVTFFGAVGGFGMACYYHSELLDSRRVIRRKQFYIDECSFED